ncbi:hypothetical protein ECP02989422_2446 [Escherichia coli P0298942.2]|nr:hypothetical protein EC1011_1067 [Escherichia coli 101-1]ENB65468.1 hypothetical protein ECP02989422_2446 [Escherichia coli P0298942.2]CDK69635.1 hypothetical protein [Klebsiella pneumoniae IS22]
MGYRWYLLHSVLLQLWWLIINETDRIFYHAGKLRNGG